MPGTDEQKAKWAAGHRVRRDRHQLRPDRARGGSDSAAVQTRATRDGDDYVLNGGKRFITNAGKASLFTVMA